jgi:D-alanyl-D-alanine dipeptidase
MVYDNRNGPDARTSSGAGGGAAPAASPGKRTLTEGAFDSAGTAPAVQRKVDPPAAEAPAAAADTRVRSGASWCAQYPTGTTIAELTDATFQANVQAFHDAMVAAATPANALNISISATYRPAQRAHLMHYSYNVHNGTTSPADANAASAAAGININWDHGDLATSRAKAGDMVTTYAIAYAPALTSRHTEGKAIDWTITWSGSLMIAKKDETAQLDCTGNGTTSTNLHAVGASYGVHKLASDPPHWSTDGH